MKSARQDSSLDPEVLEELQENFSTADTDGDGYINFAEFAGLLDDLGADMAGPDLRVGFQEIDGNHDGRINLGEFIAWWTLR
jgi:Ca2+-binding EF-hand superfamily protein